MTATSTPGGKGYATEEHLRSYFLRAGYYVSRGVPFLYEGFNVTDIDLWIYGRRSSVSREITIVDAKNKRTPQAIERIFWVQGLRLATRATSAIVATTDTRQAVKDFGKQMDVLVLDGTFLRKIAKSDDLSVRLTEEEFSRRIADYRLSKYDGDWRGRMVLSKSLLAHGLSFDACNEWLDQSRFFAEHSITKPTQREQALRCVYLILSYLAVALDYILRELSFLDQVQRAESIKNGFTFGSKGEVGMQRYINVAMGLVEQHADGGQAISRRVRANVESELARLPTNILGEYFARPEVGKSLFSIGRDLEALAMNRHFGSHTMASVEVRSFVGCLLDYFGIDRTAFSKGGYTSDPGAETALPENIPSSTPPDTLL